MKAITIWLSVLVAFFSLFAAVGELRAKLTVEHKKKLAEMRRDLSKVSVEIRRKNYDDAEATLKDIESRLKRLASEARLSPQSVIVVGILKSIATQRHTLALKTAPPKSKQQNSGVSFVKHVAPILNAKCVKCHGDDPKAKLKLNSFDGMKKGGQSGPLLFRGMANRSLLMARLTAPMAKVRMPQGGPPLSSIELQTLLLWINQGAKFDADDEEAELAELLKPEENLPPLKGWEPSGKETVSFRKHIAPWLVTYCLRCHSGKKPEGGLSLDTFEGLMRGGNRGPVVVPGKPGESRMYDLVGSFDEAKRMPANRSKILRKNWDDLGRWIFEGAKFDGGDPKMFLRALNPTESQIKAGQLAAMTPQQFVTFRIERSAEQWKAAFPDAKPQFATLNDALIFGSVSAERLETVRTWADDHLKTLRKLFEQEESHPMWTGKLTVFVLNDRSEFEHFSEAVTKRRVFAEDFAAIQITGTFEDAYIVVYDGGDKSDGDAPTLQFSLLNQMTNALLETSATGFPQWFVLGLGPALASREVFKRDKYVENLREAAVDPLSELKKPTEVFKDGVFFSSEDALPVGFTLVDFMLTKGGGDRKMTAFIKTLQAGGSVMNSIRVVYAEPDLIARNYFSTFKAKLKRKALEEKKKQSQKPTQ